MTRCNWSVILRKDYLSLFIRNSNSPISFKSERAVLIKFILCVYFLRARLLCSDFLWRSPVTSLWAKSRARTSLARKICLRFLQLLLPSMTWHRQTCVTNPSPQFTSPNKIVARAPGRRVASYMYHGIQIKNYLVNKYAWQLSHQSE